MKKFFVTTPIYYLNGEPHLGHYYATTIADVLARYNRKFGSGAFFLTGTDEHGQKVAEAAQKNNLSPQEYTDQMSAIWEGVWKDLDISYDYFIRTTNPTHKALCQVVIQKLLESDDIYPQEYEALYCVGAESFVTQSELRVGGLCPDHDEKPQIILEKNYFFRLNKYKDKVLQLIEDGKINIVPESRRNEAIELLKNPEVGDFSVTREKVSWGIPVPFDTSQTLYVWIDALFNYMSGILASQNIDIKDLSIGEILAKIGDIWPPDLQVMGKDILKFHAVYWPAFLLALGVPEENLPKTILITGFFLSDGRKMSKSIGNVIVPQDIITYFDEITDGLGNDILRYVILREMRIGNDGDITKEKIIGIYESELVNKFGNTFSRVIGMAKKYGIDLSDSNQEYKKSEIPQPQSYRIDLIDSNDDIDETLERLAKNQGEGYNPRLDILKSNYRDSMAAYDIWAAIEYIFQMVTAIGQEIESQKPWELYKEGEVEELNALIRIWLRSLDTIIEAIEPIMPSTAILMKRLLAGENIHIFPRIER
jgi:methionyl-tRNA synthetase